MKGYLFNAKTKEFISEIELQKDNLESLKQNKEIYMMPVNCTIISPPYANENEIAIYENDNWILKQDNRGKLYYIVDKDGFIVSKGIIKDLNIDISNYIFEKPDFNLYKPKYDGVKWIEGSTEEELKIIEVDNLKNIEIQKIALNEVKKTRPDLSDIIDQKIQELENT